MSSQPALALPASSLQDTGKMQRQASLETCTSLNPKDYVWGQLTSSGQQQLFGQFMQSSMSLMLPLLFPPGGFTSWMLQGASALPRSHQRPLPTGAIACAASGAVPQQLHSAAVQPAAAATPVVPAAGLQTKTAAAAETKRKSCAAVSTNTAQTKVRKQDPSAPLPPAKAAKLSTTKTLPFSSQPSTTDKNDQLYEMEPLGLDDICKLFDNDQMGDYFPVDAGFKVCPTSSPCSDPLPYTFDQDFCLDGLLDIESVMAEMSNQCEAASDLLSQPAAAAAAAAAPARSSARAAARSKAKAKKAKGGSPKKAGASQAAPQLLQ